MTLASIFRDFFPILTVFQCSGLIYFGEKETQKKFFDGKHPSSLFVVYFVVLLLALCGLSSFTVWVFIFRGKERGTILDYVVDKFVVTAIFIGTYIAAYSTVSESFLTRKKQLMFFDCIGEIDNLLTSIAPDVKISKLHKNVFARIVVSFLFIASIHSVQTYIAISTDYQPEMTKFWITSFVPVLLIGITSCKYLFYLLMLQMRLVTVSKIVEDIVEESEFCSDIIEVKSLKSSPFDVAEKISNLRKGMRVIF